MLDAIGNFLGIILSFIVNIVNDYAWSIIIFTILVRLCLLPLMVKQIKSTKAMQDIQPKMKEIQEKYKNKPEKQQEEIMKLYKDAKINPTAGCLPMFIQLPILMGLFALLRNPVSHGVFPNEAAYHAANHGFLWISSVSQTHNLSLGILSGISAYFMQKSMATTDESQAQMMKSMTIVMTAMSFWWGYTYEAGLALYWTMSNIFSIAQYYLVTSPLKAKMANSEEEVVKDEKSSDRKSNKKEQSNRQSKSLELRSKSQEEAIQKAIEQLNVDKEDIEDIKVEVIEEPSKGFLGFIGAKDGLYKITLIEKQIEIKEIDIAKEFIETMLHNAKVNADVIATQEDNLIKINIKGKEATCLIGRRGETLDAVQFLTGLALNKINKDSHCRVLVDIENYREKREQSLIRYANKVAREVAKTKKTKKLDYMNPYERRIVHSALQNDKYVITYSEGTDPYRRLVIEYKR